MKRKALGLIAAVLLAVVGTVVLASYVRDAEDRALAGEELVDVLVVTRPVEAGTPAEDLGDRVGSEQVPAKVLADEAVADLTTLEGLVATVDLVPGEQLVSSRFTAIESFQPGRSEVWQVPEGHHEVTLSLAPERALAGQLRPGDLVAMTASFDPFSLVGTQAFQILTDGMSPEEKVAFLEEFAAETEGGALLAPGDQTASTTHMILHKLTVTRVQFDARTADDLDEDDDDNRPAPSGSVFVTLAADAPTVERIVFSAEFGHVWLSYEPPGAPESGTEIITRSQIYDDVDGTGADGVADQGEVQ